jgi:anti-sigma factor RsiW
MTDEQFRSKLAEYLAGEMPENEAAAFGKMLEHDEQRGRQARELQDTQAALRSDLPDILEASRRTANLPVPSERAASARGVRGGTLRPAGGATLGPAQPSTEALTTRIRFAPLLRYAAAILIAFLAGYAARGPAEAKHETAPHPAVLPQNVEQRVVQNYAAVARAFPESSDFGRALLAISRGSEPRTQVRGQ